MAEQRWLPLESNPTSFNAWSESLGLDVSKWSFQDVYGLEPEVLEWVKQPVKAVLMLFPITEAVEKVRIAEGEQVEEDGVEGVEDVIYFKQTIANACGTFALLHALANAPDLPISEGPLTELFGRCVDKTPRERAQLLSSSSDLSNAHEASAAIGQTDTPDLEAEVDLHFVTFVEHDGFLIELDGRRESPINRGRIVKGLLEDTVEQVKKMIELTNSISFNLVTLSPTPVDD